MNFDAAFLKSRYDYERQRREQLAAALTLPIGLPTVFGGAIVAMARSFTYGDPVLTWMFGVLLASAAVAFAVCAWWLARACHPQDTTYLPLLADSQRSRDEFNEFAAVMEQYDGERVEGLEAQFDEHIIEATGRNTKNNDYRSDQLHLARPGIIAIA